MGDQVGGMRSGQEGPRPPPMPVVVRPRPVLEVLVEEVTQGGVSEEGASGFLPPTSIRSSSSRS